MIPNPELELCSDCGNPKWATCHATQLDTAAIREEFVGFHEFKGSGKYLQPRLDTPRI